MSYFSLMGAISCELRTLIMAAAALSTALNSSAAVRATRQQQVYLTISTLCTLSCVAVSHSAQLGCRAMCTAAATQKNRCVLTVLEVCCELVTALLL